MEDKLGIQVACDHHCYKDWYAYNEVVGDRRTEELDIMVAGDLLQYCHFPKLACSFIDEMPKYYNSKVSQAEQLFHR